MKNRIKYLFLMAFLWGSGHSFSQTPSVKPVKKEFFHQDTLSFIFDGLICNDGSYEWNPSWGVLKRSANGWDTLINVKQRVMMQAIIPYTTFQNYKRDFIVIDTLQRVQKDDRIYPDEHCFHNYGEYILTVLNGDGKEIVYSEPFFIRSYLEHKVTLEPFWGWVDPPTFPNPPKTDDEIVTIPDVEAEFPGGHLALKKYLDENLIYPVISFLDKIEGKAFLRFVVEKNGDISGVSVLRGVSNCWECDKEAVRLIKGMPKWTPAYKVINLNMTLDNHHPADSTIVYTTSGDSIIVKKPLRSYFTIPVTFKPMYWLLLPEGSEAFTAYISENIDYPKQALKDETKGKIAVRIEFGESRAIERASFIKGFENCNECNESVLSVLKTVPINVMTIKENVKVPFVFNMYIDFNPN